MLSLTQVCNGHRYVMKQYFLRNPNIFFFFTFALPFCKTQKIHCRYDSFTWRSTIFFIYADPYACESKESQTHGKAIWGICGSCCKDVNPERGIRDRDGVSSSKIMLINVRIQCKLMLTYKKEMVNM